MRWRWWWTPDAGYGAHRGLSFLPPVALLRLSHAAGISDRPELAWLGVVDSSPAALVTGVLAGLFGIGGGGIIVPVLYEVFGVLHVPDDVRMQLCIGTSLAIIVPTSLRAYLAHKKRGAVVCRR